MSSKLNILSLNLPNQQLSTVPFPCRRQRTTYPSGGRPRPSNPSCDSLSDRPGTRARGPAPMVPLAPLIDGTAAPPSSPLAAKSTGAHARRACRCSARPTPSPRRSPRPGHPAQPPFPAFNHARAELRTARAAADGAPRHGTERGRRARRVTNQFSRSRPACVRVLPRPRLALLLAAAVGLFLSPFWPHGVTEGSEDFAGEAAKQGGGGHHRTTSYQSTISCMQPTCC